MYRPSFDENLILRWKLWQFLHNFWYLGWNLCRTMVGTVRHGRQICILIVQRITLETKRNSRKNMTFLSFWDLERKKILLLTFFFLHFLQNCVLRLQSTNLINFSRSFFYFSQTSSFENKIVILIANNFQRSCQKCTLPAQTTIIWKIEFPMKCLTASLSIWVFRQKICRTFDGEFSVQLSELHFTCTEDHFGWKDIFLRKRSVSISLDSERKIVWLLLTSFLHCWQNCIFCRQSTMLNTCSNNFSFFHQMRDFGSEFLHF